MPKPLRQKNKFDPRLRLLAVALWSAKGALLGSFLSIGWGQNFATRTAILNNGIGVMHRVTLPLGVSSKDDVSKFEVEFGGADDYARLSINNYFVLSTERPITVPATKLGLSEKAANEFNDKFAVRRNFDIGGRVEKTFHLIPGRNFIVFEVENGLYDYCGGGFRLYINGTELRGVPGSVPVNEEEVRTLLGRSGGRLSNALCSRRVVEIDLGAPVKPLQRFRELVGL